MKKLGIYVHIPFCKQKCFYCDFCSFCASGKMEERYFNLLQKEILKRKGEACKEISSIYFGGGTPSCVDEKYIISTLETIKREYVVSHDAEITIECNPCTVHLEKLKAYKEAGFNRISFGIQSFDDKVLKTIGRLHSSLQGENAIKKAKEVGFDNISCDLIVGLPFQTEKMLLSDIERLEKLGVNHISSYMLQLEENTILFDKVQAGDLSVADDDEQVYLYEKAVEKLSQLGFEQYEVSNFAKNKTYSKHNLNYWRRGEYLGFGLSAHSFLNDVRFANSCDFQGYEKGELSQKERLSNDEIVTELIMLGLRCFEGVNLSKLEEIDKAKAEKMKNSYLIKKGVLNLENNVIKINPKFYSINNEIMLEFI